MASVTVWTCPGGGAHVETFGVEGHQVATCDVGQGQWQQVELAEPFDPSTLNAAELYGAFGAGFVVVATGLVLIWPLRLLIQSIKSSLGDD